MLQVPSIKLHKEVICFEDSMVKNSIWLEADQLAIYKHSCGVELEKQLQLVARAGLVPHTFGFQLQRSNRTGTLSPM